MGKRKDLSQVEKDRIVQFLQEKKTTLEISKMLQRDHRTVKKAVLGLTKQRVRTKRTCFKNISERKMRQLKMILQKYPLLSSSQVFQKAGLQDVKKNTRCRILQKLGRVRKAASTPPLNSTHKSKRLAWAKEHMKTDFSKVVFTDEARVTLDGPDGWSKGWMLNERAVPGRLRRQQGGGGIMIWAAIVGNELIGPFKVDDGVKLNSENYCKLLQSVFFPWYNRKSRVFKKNVVFMHDNAPSHASKATTAFLAKKGLSGKTLMTWPPSSPDLNPIENLWALLKKELYKAGKQYRSKEEVWAAIQTESRKISSETIRALTNSMDDRLVKVLQKKGNYIKM